MPRQLHSRLHPESTPRAGDSFGRPGVLLLATVCLSLLAAPVVDSQGQTAKQEPKPGRVKLIDTLTGHKFAVGFVAFVNGGKTLVSAAGGNAKFPGAEIKSWDVVTRKQTAAITLTERLSGGWAISPGGKTLAVALLTEKQRGGIVRLYDLSKGKKSQDIDTVEAPGLLEFSPDGKVLAWQETGADPKIRLWNLAAGKLIGTLTSPKPRSISSVAFSPDGKTLASVQQEIGLMLWEVGSGDNTNTLPGAPFGFSLVAFSPDGKTLAAVVNDAEFKVGVKLWDLATDKFTKTLSGDNSQIYCLAFNKGGKLLAVGTYSGKVKLWNVATGKALITLGLHDGPVFRVAFSPDGKTLATASNDMTIKLWELPADAHNYPRLELGTFIEK